MPKGGGKAEFFYGALPVVDVTEGCYSYSRGIQVVDHKLTLILDAQSGNQADRMGLYDVRSFLRGQSLSDYQQMKNGYTTCDFSNYLDSRGERMPYFIYDELENLKNQSPTEETVEAYEAWFGRVHELATRAWRLEESYMKVYTC